MTALKKPKILTVMHQETSTPGRVGYYLELMGYEMVHCRPPLGDALPETLEDYAGAIVFGGPMSANDKEDFIAKEIKWMEVPLKENKPLFGVCLGAQMLSIHLGGEVKERKDKYAEIGYYPIEATQAGRTITERWPEQVYQWHKEGFSLPSDATLLAAGEEYPNQAFAYGENAYAVQFHSEVNYWMNNKWATKAAHRFVLPGAQKRAQQLESRLMYDKGVREWLDDFLNHWVGPAEKQG